LLNSFDPFRVLRAFAVELFGITLGVNYADDILNYFGELLWLKRRKT
jgi:hypothetical protein